MKKKRVNRNTRRRNKTKRRNTRRRNKTKRKNTRRMDNRRGNTKRNTKRRQRGGMFLPPLPVVAVFNALTGRNAGDYGIPEAATPAEPAPEPITFDFLNKFFDVTQIEGEPQGRYEYKLKGDLQVIHSHGRVLPTYTVVPEGITLYFLVGAGIEARITFARNYGRLPETARNTYIRAYQSGSLVQDSKLNFIPFAEENEDQNWSRHSAQARPHIGINLPSILTADRETLTYAPMGLLNYKLNDGDRHFKSEFECEEVNCDYEAMNYLIKIIIANVYELGLNKIKKWYMGLSSDEKIEIGSEDGVQWPDDLKILKSYVEKHLDIFYRDNLDQIYKKEELFSHSTFAEVEKSWAWEYWHRTERLSVVLHRIAEVMKTDDSISGDWFCTFCRSGEPLNIDTLLACQEEYFEPLPGDFFNEDIQFKGAKLRRENSLASKSETANFKQTVDALQEYCQGGGAIPQLDTAWHKLDYYARQEVKGKLNDIHMRLHNGEPVRLEPHEVCFIFQLKNHLQKQGLI